MIKAQKSLLMFVMAGLIMLVGYMDTAVSGHEAALVAYKFWASLLVFTGCCMTLHSVFVGEK